MCTRSRTRWGTRCTPGIRSARRLTRITITRSSWRRSPPLSTRNYSRTICSRRRTDDRRHARVSHQPPDRRPARHALSADHVCRVRKGRARARGSGRGTHARFAFARCTTNCSSPTSGRTSRSIPELDHGMPAHSTFLQRVLRVQVRDRHFGGGHARRKKFCGGGAADLQAYLGFLQSGGSEYPLETLQRAGVDLSTPAPVDAALDRV